MKAIKEQTGPHYGTAEALDAEVRENSAEAKKSNYRDYDKSPMLLSIPEEFMKSE